MTTEPTGPERSERPPSWWLILACAVGAIVLGLLVGELTGRPGMGTGVAAGLGGGVAGTLLARRWRATGMTTELRRRDRRDG